MLSIKTKAIKILAITIATALVISSVIVSTSNKNNSNAISHSISSDQKLHKSFLIKGEKSREAVLAVGGTITHELKIIDSIAANLSKQQFQEISKMGVSLTPNQPARSSGLAWGQRIDFSQASAVQMSNAEALHKDYIFGDGVTIAVIDSGFKSLSGLRQDAYGRLKVYGT